MVWPGVAENHLLLLWAWQETGTLLSSFSLIPVLTRLCGLNGTHSITVHVLQVNPHMESCGFPCLFLVLITWNLVQMNMASRKLHLRGLMREYVTSLWLLDQVR